MTKQRFFQLLIRLNLGILVALPVGIWSYGALIGDLPPLSILPGLYLLGVMICVGASALMFAAIHLWLTVKAKREGEVSELFSKRSAWAFFLGVVLTPILPLYEAAISGRKQEFVWFMSGMMSAAGAVCLLYLILAMGFDLFKKRIR